MSFLSLLSLGSNAKTDGAFHSKTVHCINLLYLCHKKERIPSGILSFLFVMGLEKRLTWYNFKSGTSFLCWNDTLNCIEKHQHQNSMKIITDMARIGGIDPSLVSLITPRLLSSAHVRLCIRQNMLRMKPLFFGVFTVLTMMIYHDKVWTNLIRVT